MQYVLMIREDESFYEGDDGAARMEQTIAGHMKLAKELTESGLKWSGERLKGDATATTVKWNAGTSTLHDGPFAETHEELGGFYIVDVGNLDEAVEWAKKIPVPGKGSIEIRPVWEK